MPRWCWRWASAVLLLAAVLAGCGSSGPHYTATDNPCVNSRIANGDWRQQGIPRQLALAGARTLCSYGPAFNGSSDFATGDGPNTSGWDDPEIFSGTPQTGSASNGSAATSTPASVPSSAAPVSVPSPANDATPADGATRPASCPGSAALLAAWNATPATAFRAQSIAKGLRVSGFTDVSCWHGWIVASPVADANGLVVFTARGGLHLLSAAEMREFNSTVCSASAAPAAWKSHIAGPANC